MSGRSKGEWVLTGILVLVFLAAGGNKLADTASAIQQFSDHFGLPGWLAVVIGLCEVAGAIGLLIPRFSKLAAAGLSVIMLGAAGSHIRADDPFFAPLIPIVLLALLGTFLWMQVRSGGEDAAPAG
jgi:putative oxidoreductase